MCATNIDIEAALRDGKVREDLYFRINTIALRVPPLRERTEDIPLLCDYFLDRFRQRYQRNVKTLAPSVYHVLIRNRWAGNVRELENAIERAVLVAKGSEITVADLPESIREESSSSADFVIPPHRTLAEIEKMAILQTLQRTNWNKQEAAQILGLYRPTLYSKMKKHEIGDAGKASQEPSSPGRPVTERVKLIPRDRPARRWNRAADRPVGVAWPHRLLPQRQPELRRIDRVLRAPVAVSLPPARVSRCSERAAADPQQRTAVFWVRSPILSEAVRLRHAAARRLSHQRFDIRHRRDSGARLGRGGVLQRDQHGRQSCMGRRAAAQLLETPPVLVPDAGIAGLILLVALLLVSASHVVGASWFAGVLAAFPAWRCCVALPIRYATILLFILVVGLVYYIVPNTKVRFRDVWVGAVVTGLLWKGGLEAFSWYVRDMSRFTRVNGSIAVVVVFLVWVYTQAVILLYGVEFTAAYAHLRRGRAEESKPATMTATRQKEPG